MKSYNKSFQNETKDLANDIGNIVSSCYGVIKFGVGDLLKTKIGSKRSSMENGGVSVRLHNDKRVFICIHIIVSYRVSIRTLVTNMSNGIKYLLEKKGYNLSQLDIYVDGIELDV